MTESFMENAQTERPVERLVRIGEVKRLTGLSTATLYRKISANEFPRPVQLGTVARAWPLSEVQDWIAGRSRCAKRTGVCREQVESKQNGDGSVGPTAPYRPRYQSHAGSHY